VSMQPFLSATGGAGLPATQGEQSGCRAKAYHPHGSNPVIYINRQGRPTNATQPNREESARPLQIRPRCINIHAVFHALRAIPGCRFRIFRNAAGVAVAVARLNWGATTNSNHEEHVAAALLEPHRPFH